MRYARLTDVKKESTMRIAIRHALALAAVVLALAWARPAQAQVTITGVVGEVAAFANAPGMGAVIRFKLTDAAQTAACADVQNGGVILKYAFMFPNVNTDVLYKEW